MLVPMNPVDSLFLLGESIHRPMHMGGLAMFTPPDGSAASDVHESFAAAVERDVVADFWRRRARRSITSLGQWGWDRGGEVDLDYHVQTWALPQPAGMAELWALVSGLHSVPLDRSRPLWELHLIEGLSDGRQAVYVKIHHALVDGVSAMGLLSRSLSPDPSVRGMAPMWEVEPDQRGAPSSDSEAPGVGGLPGVAAAAAWAAVTEGAGLIPAFADTVDRALRRRGGPLTVTAPRTVFNAPVSSSRVVNGRSWPMERLALVAKSADSTINDVVLAMCSGALRRHLAARDALPTAPLVAMVPVSLRGDPRDGDRSGPDAGNRIGALTCTLATNLPDPADRLATISTVMREGKAALAPRSRLQILAMSALGASPLAVGMLTGHEGPLRPPNIIISNVPGPRSPLYWNGAHLSSLYPLSVPVHGQPLNITCVSNDDQIDFGLTGCASVLRNLSAMPADLDSELASLEAAVGV